MSEHVALIMYQPQWPTRKWWEFLLQTAVKSLPTLLPGGLAPVSQSGTTERLLNKAQNSADFIANACFARLLVVLRRGRSSRSLPLQTVCHLQPFTAKSKMLSFFSALSNPPLLRRRSNSAATTPSTGLPTAPPTGACQKGTRTLWRRLWPPSDPSQSASTPSSPSFASTTAVGGRDWFWGGRGQDSVSWNDVSCRCVQRSGLLAQGEPRRASRGLRDWGQHGLLAD